MVSGTLIVSQKTTDASEEVHMYSAYPGEMVGGLAVLTGEPSSFTIRAKHFSRIALLSKNTFYKYVYFLLVFIIILFFNKSYLYNLFNWYFSLVELII